MSKKSAQSPVANDPSRQRFASASGPVNRRTAGAARAPVPVQTHPSVRQRLALLQARHRLGAPLSQRLTGGTGRLAQRATRPISIAVVVALTLSAAGGFLAWLQASTGWALAAGGLAVGSAMLWAWGRRGRSALAQAPSVVVFDAQALAQLDQVLSALAGELNAAQLQALRTLADTLERMRPLIDRVGVNELFTQEDRFYVTECVRRYLPDTLQAFLQVPASGRRLAGDDGPSPDALLAHQLVLLQAELTRREEALLRASAEALSRQQRFLAAKGRRGA